MFTSDCCGYDLGAFYGSRLQEAVNKSDFLMCPSCGNLCQIKLTDTGYDSGKNRKCEASVSSFKRQLVFARDAWTCKYCGLEAKDFIIEHVKNSNRNGRLFIYPLDDRGKKFTIDHILPRIRGGDNDINNLCTSCYRCNNRKGASRFKVEVPRITLFD